MGQGYSPGTAVAREAMESMVGTEPMVPREDTTLAAAAAALSACRRWLCTGRA